MATAEEIADLNARYQDLYTRTQAGEKGLYRQVQALGKELNTVKGSGASIGLRQKQGDLLADIGSRLGDYDAPTSPAATDVAPGSPTPSLPSIATDVGSPRDVQEPDRDQVLDLIERLEELEKTFRGRPKVRQLAQDTVAIMGGDEIDTSSRGGSNKNRDILAAVRERIGLEPLPTATAAPPTPVPEPVPEPAPIAQSPSTPAASQQSQAVSFGLATFSAARSLASGAAGLLGVPGTTSAVVDAQRAEQEDEIDNSLPDKYSTEGLTIEQGSVSAGALSQWAQVAARTIDAQRAHPDTQAAIAGAAIEALARRATGDKPSPHEVRAINTVLTAATQTAAPSPVREYMLDRIQQSAATQTTGPAPQANQAEFLRARAGLTRAVGTSPEVRRLDPQFSSVSRQSVAVGSPLATAVAGTQTAPVAQPVIQVPNQPIAMAAVPPTAPDRTDDIIGAVRGAARQQTRDTSVGRRRQTGQITQAIADAAQRGELNAVQLAAVEDNLKDAPLTAQMVAQGRLKPLQVLDPAEVASYEKALSERRVKEDSEGREAVQRSTSEAAFSQQLKPPLSIPDGAKAVRCYVDSATIPYSFPNVSSTTSRVVVRIPLSTAPSTQSANVTLELPTKTTTNNTTPHHHHHHTTFAS